MLAARFRPKKGETMMRSFQRSIFMLIGFTSAALLLAGCGSVWAAQGSFDRTLQVTGTVQLDVETSSGFIHVHAGPPSKVEVHGTIKATPGGGLSAEERAQRLEQNPPIEQNGNMVRVGHITDPDLRRSVSISYDLVVPQETEIKADSGSGDESIKGVKGPVKADTGSGSIEVSDIEEDAKADTGSGSIRATSIKGSVHADTGSGSVYGSDLAGGLWADTGSGNIEVERLKGGLHADTGSGRISVEGEISSEWKLDAGSGGIEIRLPKEAAFDLDAEADSGNISVDHALMVEGTMSTRQVRGRVRGGGPLVRARTGSGSIRVE